MSDFIQILIQKYELMKEEISLLRDNSLMIKLNRLVDILYKEKYGLYLGNNTSGLTEASIQNSWPLEKSVWDNV